MPKREFHWAVVAVLCILAFSSTALAEGFDHDHSLWSSILKKVVKEGKVDYVQLVRDPSDLLNYVKTMGKLKKKSFEKFDRNQKIVYWVNLYNALTILSVTRNYPILPDNPDPLYPKSSIRQVPGVWMKTRFKTVLGTKTLKEMETQYINQFKEPLLNFVVVNSSIGGPKMVEQALRADTLEQQVNEAVRNFVLDANNIRAEPTTKTLFISEMFIWKASQFVPRYFKLGHFKRRSKQEVSVLNFLNNYAGMMEKMMILKDDFKIKYIKYDWSLNER